MLSLKAKNEISQLAEMFDTTHQAVSILPEYQEHVVVKTQLTVAIGKQLDAGIDPAELRALFTNGTISLEYFNRLVTEHNRSAGKTGKTGGGGGSKKQKAKTGKASTAAKKTVKKSATLDVAIIDATLAAVRANLLTNIAESNLESRNKCLPLVDFSRKTASLADIEIIGKLVAKSVRSIADKTAIVTDALPKAKPSKAKAKSNGKAPKVQKQNRIANADKKALAA